jgi:uncharacterized protein (TIGR03437 family)
VEHGNTRKKSRKHTEGLSVFFRFLFCVLPCLGLLAAQNNPARGVALDLSKVVLPAGFRLALFSQNDVPGARFMAFSPAGTLFVSSLQSGRIYALPDHNGVGRPDRIVIFAQGLDQPHGLAFRGNDLYVAENRRVIVYRNVEPGLTAGTPQELTQLVPAVGHITHTLVFGPDGRMYVATGSDCNLCVESDPRRAAVVRFNADGSGSEIFARGLRNSVGLRFHPATGDLWATDNGRDYLGDDLPSEEINIVRQGLDYGWPYCHGDKVPNPEFNDQARCDVTEAPAWKIQAHSAGLGFDFYTGSWFPAAYRGDIFVALHGSWNRSVPTGYKVARVRVSEGRPLAMEDFISGWLNGETTMARPVDILTGPEGALYISDDAFNRIYRVTYDALGAPLANGGGVTNAATFSSAAAAAPGSLVSIFGTNFLGRTWQASALPLPMQVDSLTLTIGGRPVPLLFSNATQINAQVPTGMSGTVELKITTAGGSQTSMIALLPAAPGIFTQDSSGKGDGAIRNATRGGLVSPASPAKAGDFLEIYCTGLNGLTPAVTLAGRGVPVVFAGSAPGLAGVDQVNVQIPASLPVGQLSLSMSAAGQTSNSVLLAVN